MHDYVRVPKQRSPASPSPGIINLRDQQNYLGKLNETTAHSGVSIFLFYNRRRVYPFSLTTESTTPAYTCSLYNHRKK